MRKISTTHVRYIRLNYSAFSILNLFKLEMNINLGPYEKNV